MLIYKKSCNWQLAFDNKNFVPKMQYSKTKRYRPEVVDELSSRTHLYQKLFSHTWD